MDQGEEDTPTGLPRITTASSLITMPVFDLRNKWIIVHV